MCLEIVKLCLSKKCWVAWGYELWNGKIFAIEWLAVIIWVLKFYGVLYRQMLLKGTLFFFFEKWYVYSVVSDSLWYHGQCRIFLARTLEWVAVSSSRGSSQPRDRAAISGISCIGRCILYLWAPGKPFWEEIVLNLFPLCMRTKVLCLVSGCSFGDIALLRHDKQSLQVSNTLLCLSWK